MMQVSGYVRNVLFVRGTLTGAGGRCVSWGFYFSLHYRCYRTLRLPALGESYGVWLHKWESRFIYSDHDPHSHHSLLALGYFSNLSQGPGQLKEEIKKAGVFRKASLLVLSP